MRKLIIFKADKGEIQKYRQLTETKIGESFYRVANIGVPSLVTTIAEHYDCTNNPLPETGYRLTETVPEDRESFRDSGWEVVRVEEYEPKQPVEFDVVCVCYCTFESLSPEDAWTKKSRRIGPTLEDIATRTTTV